MMPTLAQVVAFAIFVGGASAVRKSIVDERTKLGTIFFLHFPKCGTSFHNTVNRYACDGVPDSCVFGDPGYECSFDSEAPQQGRRKNVLSVDDLNCSVKIHPRGGHVPLSTAADRPHTVAMFRHPQQRLLAAPAHPSGMPTGVDYSGSGAAHQELNFTTADVVRMPGKLGCMTKMLTGLRCAASVIDDARATAVFEEFIAQRRAGKPAIARRVLERSVDEEQRELQKRLPRALVALDQLFFVGITEDTAQQYSGNRGEANCR